jgi:serine/threonine protein kinase
MNTIINKKYQILEKIGTGKFGIVYKGTNIKTNEIIAIKTESRNSSIKLLKNETAILKYLYDHGSRSTPIVYWYGVDNLCSYLVMSFYEISLYDYSIKTPLSVEKIDKVMSVSIDILENIHTQFVIHRDIKPQNFMISNEEIFLIDFGFATFYIEEYGEHLQHDENKNITGTPKYISYNIHDGISPSRRDDLISLGYIYLYLYCKELPWDKMKIEINKNDYAEIDILHPKNQQRKCLKSWENIEEICLQINQKIHKFLNYCYNLSYDSSPDYTELKKLFIS